jgi:23S rRNA (guanosine2251-2'-O)-methyltransferase
MKTYCPYPDCNIVYEIDAPDKPPLFNAICSQCLRLGRVKALEIVDKLKVKEAKINQMANHAFTLAGQGEFQVLLEDIRSLWNVGSIFRTADAIGISNLYLCGITGCPPRSEISKTALGAEEDIPWTYSCQALDTVNILKKAGIIILGLERNNDSINLVKLLKEQKIQKPFCLAVGNEVAGLSPELIESCDYICDLPMKGKKESLNVASAFAVAAYFIDEFI